MNRSISILGCGWYGLELAKALVLKGYKIKGSTTSAEKLSLLNKEGIEPYLVNFKEDNPDFDQRFFNSSMLIVCIPPKRSTGEQAGFSKKIVSICNAAKHSPIKNVLFISSTSVYGDKNHEIDESAVPDPNTASGIAMIKTEKIVQASFKTTILRFAGLVGPGRDPGRFLAGKTDIPNGRAPINLIHLKDCIGLSIEIIEKNKFGYIFNGCTPDHPARQDFYEKAAAKSGLTKPIFIDQLDNWKIVSSIHIPATLQYKYLVNSWTDWLNEDKL